MVAAAKYARAERQLKPARVYGTGALGMCLHIVSHFGWVKSSHLFDSGLSFPPPFPLCSLQPCTRRPRSKPRRRRPASIWSSAWPLIVVSVAPSTPVWPRPSRAGSPAWPMLARRSWWSTWETSWEACCTGRNRNGVLKLTVITSDEGHESAPVLLLFTQQLFSWIFCLVAAANGWY